MTKSLLLLLMTCLGFGNQEGIIKKINNSFESFRPFKSPVRLETVIGGKRSSQKGFFYCINKDSLRIDLGEENGTKRITLKDSTFFIIEGKLIKAAPSNLEGNSAQNGSPASFIGPKALLGPRDSINVIEKSDSILEVVKVGAGLTVLYNKEIEKVVKISQVVMGKKVQIGYEYAFIVGEVFLTKITTIMGPVKTVLEFSDIQLKNGNMKRFFNLQNYR